MLQSSFFEFLHPQSVCIVEIYSHNNFQLNSVHILLYIAFSSISHFQYSNQTREKAENCHSLPFPSLPFRLWVWEGAEYWPLTTARGSGLRGDSSLRPPEERGISQSFGILCEWPRSIFRSFLGIERENAEYPIEKSWDLKGKWRAEIELGYILNGSSRGSQARNRNIENIRVLERIWITKTRPRLWFVFVLSDYSDSFFFRQSRENRECEFNFSSRYRPTHWILSSCFIYPF